MSDNNTLLDKLDTLVARFEEVSTLITDPAVIADQKRYVKLTKEYKELGDLMKARKEYVQVLGGIDEAKDIIANETDPEMRDMAREELDRCEARRPQLEEEIKLLLIPADPPADPQDSRNAILEIRGGTGGDEAALFAGDLFRMYSKYCERKGWRLEVSSANEGAAGGFKEIICSVTGEGVYGTLKGYIHPPHPWPYCPKPNRSMWKSTRAKSNGTPSEAAAQADRTSTKWKAACAYAITGRTPIRAWWRKSSSNVPRRATSPRTRNVP